MYRNAIQRRNGSRSTAATNRPSSDRVSASRMRPRIGAAVVEFAFICLPIFILIFGTIELGRGMMAMQSLEEAARSGCRSAVVRDATTSDVNSQVSLILNASGISPYTTSIQPSDLDNVPQWEPVTVTISADVAAFSWLPVPEFLAGKTLTASCVLPREAAIETP